MRVVRQTPKAINKPLLVVGVERSMMAGLLMIGAVVGSQLHWLVGLVVFFGGCFAAKRATRKDPDFLKVAARAAALRPIYDPVKRQVTK